MRPFAPQAKGLKKWIDQRLHVNVVQSHDAEATTGLRAVD